MEWRLISSAPKDGGQYDLWHMAGYRIADCRWSELDLAYESPNHFGIIFPDDATHWRKAPPPPSEGEG